MRRWMELVCILSFVVLVCGAVAQETKVHVVKKGDTLWDLSAYYLANPFLWPGIYDANKDKINDPHWIYPGQAFTIPPVYPAMPPMPEVPPVGEEGVEVAPEPVVEEPGLEATVPIKTYEVPAVAARLALFGGYLARDEEITGGYIIASEPPKTENLTSSMTVYIDRGSMDGVNEGDLYTIFRIDRGIRHPKTGEYLGRIVRVLGVLSVAEVEDRTSRALIDRSFEIIHLQDRIMPYVPDVLPIGEIPEPTSDMLEGYIVARRDTKDILKPFGIVYIDQGMMVGARVGDVFEIYRPARRVDDPGSGESVLLPESVVGALQVLKLKEDSATAYVVATNGKVDLKAGELIRLKSRLPAGG